MQLNIYVRSAIKLSNELSLKNNNGNSKLFFSLDERTHVPLGPNGPGNGRPKFFDTYRGFAWRPCCMPETIKMFCIRMNILPHRNNIVLFLACYMAAVQNLDLYSLYMGFRSPPRRFTTESSHLTRTGGLPMMSRAPDMNMYTGGSKGGGPGVWTIPISRFHLPWCRMIIFNNRIHIWQKNYI